MIIMWSSEGRDAKQNETKQKGQTYKAMLFSLLATVLIFLWHLG